MDRAAEDKVTAPSAPAVHLALSRAEAVEMERAHAGGRPGREEHAAALASPSVPS